MGPHHALGILQKTGLGILIGENAQRVHIEALVALESIRISLEIAYQCAGFSRFKVADRLQRVEDLRLAGCVRTDRRKCGRHQGWNGNDHDKGSQQQRPKTLEISAPRDDRKRRQQKSRCC